MPSADQNRAFLLEFFSVIDSMQPRAFAERFRSDGRFIFANNAPAEGHSAIAAVASSVFDQLRGIGHELIRFAEDTEGVLLIEGRVSYAALNREDLIVLPFACCLHRDGDGLISEYRSFVDIAPLFRA